MSHEISTSEAAVFVTLTYAPEFLPEFGSLRYRDFQLFMKRMRRAFGRGVRFFMCGEYGENLSRPHYHAVLFNCDFPDREIVRGGSYSLYSSRMLDRLWGLGRCTVGTATFESAAYVARYVMKKVNGELAKEHYRVVDPVTGEIGYRVPEFLRCSLKPGIGAAWYMLNGREVAVTDAVLINGKEVKPPRYYDKLHKRIAPLSSRDKVEARELEAYGRRADNTPERLSVKRQVAEAKLSKLKRHGA